ncbi:MAG: ROK family protein [Mobilitalea sp.]
MNEKRYLGIDIGGTKTNIGIVSEDGTVLIKKQIRSNLGFGITAYVQDVCDHVFGLLTECNLMLDEIARIGIGIPGTANSKTGIVEYSSNLFGCDIPLAKYFEERLMRKIDIVQDSWAAAWGEKKFGAGRNFENFACVTLGTGIGCGVIINNDIYSGPMHTACEIGHTPIMKDGRNCSCGKKGCLETYASGTAILKQAMEQFPEKMYGKERAETVFTLADSGDEQAAELITSCVDKLAYGLAILIDITSIDTILISGGLCVHKKRIIDPLPELIMGYGYDSWAKEKRIKVIQAELGSDAPMIGASHIFEQIDR